MYYIYKVVVRNRFYISTAGYFFFWYFPMAVKRELHKLSDHKNLQIKKGRKKNPPNGPCNKNRGPLCLSVRFDISGEQWKKKKKKLSLISYRRNL